MKRAILNIAVLFLPCSCYSADYNNAAVWVYPNNSGGSISYEVDWAGKEYSLPSITEWSWGRPSAIIVNCESGGGPNTTFLQRKSNVIAYPRSVQLTPGFDAIITLSGDIKTDKINNWLLAIGGNQDWHENTQITSCTAVGELYKGSYPPPSNKGITAKIKIPNGMPTGNYDIRIPVKSGFYSQGYNYGSPVEISSFDIFSALIHETAISVNLSVRNSCTYDVQNLELEHGSRILGEAPGNKVFKDITVTCTGPTNVRLSLTSLSIPSLNVPGRYRAGLGNGWDSLLTINGQSSEFVDYFNTAGSKKYTIGSELIKGSNASEGLLSGSAVLIISPE